MTKPNAAASQRPARGELLDAVWVADLEDAKDLIARGADVNEEGDEGVSPLILAALISPANMALVELLIEKGADVNHKSAEGYTALMAAAKRNDDDMVKLLLDKGARVDERSLKGHTALTWTVICAAEEAARLLLARGADPTAKGTDGSVPLEWLGGRRNINLNREALEGLGIYKALTQAVESRRAAAAAQAAGEARAVTVADGHDLAAVRQKRLIALAKQQKRNAP